MANQRNGNMIYVDTTDSTFSADRVLLSVILLANHATAVGAVTLQNNSASPTTLMTLQVDPEIEKTKHFNFADSPLLFPDGIKITTLSNAVITLIIDKQRA